MQNTRTRRSFAGEIFISHASQDRHITAAIASCLYGWGFHSLFLDFDPEYGIPAGRDWEREIYKQISTSGAMIALCSHYSAQSKWCFAERAQARALGKELFPITLDDTVVSHESADMLCATAVI